MQRLERLVNLLAALLDTSRPLSREELRDRVPGYSASDEAFRRAFERDKEALRAMGVPVAMEPLDMLSPDLGDGYRVPREAYELADPGLAEDELAALHLAARAVRLEGSDGTGALLKLGGVVGENGTEQVAALQGSKELPALFDAIAQRRVLTFSYRGANRELEPARLAFRGGHWYVNGFDRLRQDLRSFRVDRIAGSISAGPPDAFETRPASGRIKAPPWAVGDEEPMSVLVSVDAELTPIVLNELGDNAVATKNDDGSSTLTLRVTSRTAFRTWVLGQLHHVVIIEPPEYRSDLVEWLDAMVAR